MSASLAQFPSAIPQPDTASQVANAWLLRHHDELISRAGACFCRMDADRREEAIAETLAASFASAVSAARHGTLTKLTPFWCVTFAGRRFRSGRRFAGTNARCVMSEVAQVRGRSRRVKMTLEAAPNDWDDIDRERLREALTTSDDEDPAEIVRRDHDFPAMLKKESVSRKATAVFRFLVESKSEGHQCELADELHVTGGRVSQLKHELADAFARHDYTGPLGPRPSVCSARRAKAGGR